VATRSEKFRIKKSVFDAIRKIDLQRDKVTPLSLIDQYLTDVGPDDVDMLRLKANVLDIQLRRVQSLGIYKKLLRLNPSDVLALIDVGDLYAHRGQYAHAIRYYNRAFRAMEQGHCNSGMYSYIGKGEEWITVCKGKANALLELNRTMDALKCILQGLQRTPAEPLLGDLLRKAQAHHAKTEIAKGTTARRSRGRTTPTAGR